VRLPCTVMYAELILTYITLRESLTLSCLTSFLLPSPTRTRSCNRLNFGTMLLSAQAFETRLSPTSSSRGSVSRLSSDVFQRTTIRISLDTTLPPDLFTSTEATLPSSLSSTLCRSVCPSFRTRAGFPYGVSDSCDGLGRGSCFRGFFFSVVNL
jgi:hypothetical protein